jgi:rhodanese-related sulfurtransferase
MAGSAVIAKEQRTMTSIFRITFVSAMLACLIALPIVSAKDLPPLPKAKETTLGLYLTASEAYDKWKASPDKVKVLDVRTPDEFLFIGHAPMAWNVPLAVQTFQWDAAKKQFPMQPLPDFIDRARKVAGPQDTLLVMCRSGGRSAMAVNLLANAGYKNVYNITDGFEGDTVKDPGSVFDGQHMVNGWRNSGLPWTYEVDPARMVLPPGR